EKAHLYTAIFFLGSTTSFIGDLYPITPGPLHAIFLFFPPAGYAKDVVELGVTRLGGIASAANMVYLAMICRYGLRRIFLGGKLWRPAVLVSMIFVTLYGGFRSTILMEVMVFVIVFFSEGLHRTKLLPLFFFIGAFMFALALPLAHRLPYTFQRALAFLPLNLDTAAVMDANNSTEWRFQMWSALLPQIPSHLLIGKGYAIRP